MTHQTDALDIEPIRALLDERNRTWLARKAHGDAGDKRLLKDAKQRLRTQSLMLNAEVPKLLAEIERLRALLTNPAHALAASHAECERLRKAAANVAAMYQTDPLATVDGLTDTDFIMRISALRAALAAQGGGT